MCVSIQEFGQQFGIQPVQGSKQGKDMVCHRYQSESRLLRLGVIFLYLYFCLYICIFLLFFSISVFFCITVLMLLTIDTVTWTPVKRCKQLRRPLSRLRNGVSLKNKTIVHCSQKLNNKYCSFIYSRRFVLRLHRARSTQPPSPLAVPGVPQVLRLQPRPPSLLLVSGRDRHPPVSGALWWVTLLND